jgi:hypothetical protein
MYWVINNGDFEGKSLKEIVNNMADYACDIGESLIIDNVYCVFNNEKERQQSNKTINLIQFKLDSLFERRIKATMQEIKAQQQIESEYKGGRL